MPARQEDEADSKQASEPGAEVKAVPAVVAVAPAAAAPAAAAAGESGAGAGAGAGAVAMVDPSALVVDVIAPIAATPVEPVKAKRVRLLL